MKYKTRP